MRKQTVLLLSTLVVLSAVSMQQANACSWKFCQKKEKPVIEVPVKKEMVPVNATEPAVEKKEVPAVKVAPTVKPAVAPTVKPAPVVAKPVVKPACKCAKTNCGCVKPTVKPPVKK